MLFACDGSVAKYVGRGELAGDGRGPAERDDMVYVCEDDDMADRSWSEVELGKLVEEAVVGVVGNEDRVESCGEDMYC
jgi:hypothetical protein